MVAIKEDNIETWEKDPNGRVLNVSVVGRKVFLSMGKIVAGIYVAQVRFGIRVRVRVRRDSAIKKLLKIFLLIFSIYFYY